MDIAANDAVIFAMSALTKAIVILRRRRPTSYQWPWIRLS
ncbi:MAG: hypothetical protein OJF58_001118 [Enhydrobacter sp.]|nr:MAG: hypothetical protein OJF58_001118 [Enhydrobacter sp.]